MFVTTQYAGLYIFSECGPFPDAHASFIPAAAFAAGAEGAFFQTDVEINNRGALEAEVYFEWLPRGEDNSGPDRSATFALGPGESLRFENVLTTLFELGPDSLGALELVSSTGTVIGMSRTYNIPAGGAVGTFGQGLPAIRASEMLAGTRAAAHHLPEREPRLQGQRRLRQRIERAGADQHPGRSTTRAPVSEPGRWTSRPTPTSR